MLSGFAPQADMPGQATLATGANENAGHSGPALNFSETMVGYCRYCWMRVVRRPARPCWSIEYCQERNSSTVSV